MSREKDLLCGLHDDATVRLVNLQAVCPLRLFADQIVGNSRHCHWPVPEQLIKHALKETL